MMDQYKVDYMFLTLSGLLVESTVLKGSRNEIRNIICNINMEAMLNDKMM